MIPAAVSPQTIAFQFDCDSIVFCDEALNEHPHAARDSRFHPAEQTVGVGATLETGDSQPSRIPRDPPGGIGVKQCKRLVSSILGRQPDAIDHEPLV